MASRQMERPSLTLDLVFGHMNCCGQGDVCEDDLRRGCRQACTVGFASCTQCSTRTHSGPLLPLQPETQEERRAENMSPAHSVVPSPHDPQYEAWLTPHQWIGYWFSKPLRLWSLLQTMVVVIHYWYNLGGGCSVLKLRSWLLRHQFLLVPSLFPVFTDHICWPVFCHLIICFCPHGFYPWIFFLLILFFLSGQSHSLS